jgi:hypothetical protein
LYKDLASEARLDEFSRHQHDLEGGISNREEEEDPEERMRLMQMQPGVIVEYVKSSIDIMMALKVEDDAGYQQELFQQQQVRRKERHEKGPRK